MTRRRQLLFRIATPLLIFLVAEVALRTLVDARLRLSLAERRTMAPYRGKPWADQYFKDLLSCASQSAHAAQGRYVRYVLQDINESCTTATVNYANRMRKTWNPEIPAGATVYELAMFGGSTMEGLGAIDDETIPSQFSHILNGTGGPVVYHVTNYGVSGYTFTQSIIKLTTLLRDGRHFDGVIFYGGDNDIDYAYNMNEVGALEDEGLVRTRLEGSVIQRIVQFGKEQANACVLCLAGVIAVRNTPFLKDHLSPALVRLRDVFYFKKGQSDGDDIPAMAGGIAQYYAGSHALLAQIAGAYHLQYLDVWQPSLMYENDYALGEEALSRMDTRLRDAKLRRLYTQTRDDVVKLHLTQFEDVSHALDGRAGAAYLDAVHLSGDANGVVARSMYESWKAGAR